MTCNQTPRPYLALIPIDYLSAAPQPTYATIFLLTKYRFTFGCELLPALMTVGSGSEGNSQREEPLGKSFLHSSERKTEQHLPRSLVMRLVDDFIFILPCKTAAAALASRLIAGWPLQLPAPSHRSCCA